MDIVDQSDIQYEWSNVTETHESGRSKQLRSYAHRLAFSQFVSSLQSPGRISSVCCGIEYLNTRDLYKHVNSTHHTDIEVTAERILTDGSEDAKWKLMQKKPRNSTDAKVNSIDSLMPHNISTSDEFPWLPTVDKERVSGTEENSRILLFYSYRHVPDTQHVKKWQEVLCTRLQLTGKVRVAEEGINGTVSGSVFATELYMSAVMRHPFFSHMTRQQFKMSAGIENAFPDGLRVSVHDEACPMGIRPDRVPHTDGGIHLTPDQFHRALCDLSSLPERRSQSVLVDCRNYYESKIGRCDGAVAPDIRKFSYWPRYIDENAEMFRGKDVYMYCTGGIRCERGSAYLKKQGLCREVYQLEGGIHKYAEQYPDGHFKGKLFVFDNRYAIPVNNTVLSVCVYCGKPWDNYEPCSSRHCYQLVLSCPTCREQQLTACCAPCQRNHELELCTEECDCTRKRGRSAPPKAPSGRNES